MNVQPLLIGGKGIATDLHVVVSESSKDLLVFLDTALLECIGGSREALQYKMLAGRLANAGWPLIVLQRALGHDRRTVKKWAAALLSDDVDEVARAFGGRGQDRKVTAAVSRYVKKRYRELNGQRRDFRRTVAGEVADLFGERLSPEVLRRLFREADREDRSARLALAGSAAGLMSMGCEDGGLPGTEQAANDNRSPEGAVGPPGGSGADGTPPAGSAEGPPELPAVLCAAPSRPVGVHHAGLVLFLVLFMAFVRGRRPWADLQRQWLGQVLQGAVNLEQSRMVTATDLARFTGPVVAGVEAQREHLRELAGVETVMDLYAANARLLHDGPGRGTVFYYDPHGKEYTGQLTVLKGWCGRACFVQHYSSPPCARVPRRPLRAGAADCAVHPSRDAPRRDGPCPHRRAPRDLPEQASRRDALRRRPGYGHSGQAAVVVYRAGGNRTESCAEPLSVPVQLGGLDVACVLPDPARG